MTQKGTSKLFILALLVLLAALPAAVLAEEGQGAMTGEAMMAEVSCQQDYTVQSDDWLSKIAEKFYGNVLAFPAIAQATNAHYKAAMMAEGDKAMAGEEMMTAGQLMVQSTHGQAMEAMMADDGKLMVKGADGQMMELKVGEDGSMMAADGSMVDGKLVLESADGQMMEVMMSDGKLMTKDANGQMMEVAMGDKAMAGEAMGNEAMADQAVSGEEAMTAGSYALIENPDLIEPGWVLCVPSADDAQKLLSEAAMAQ